MNFKARAKKLLEAVSGLSFDQSGDPTTGIDLLTKALKTAWDQGHQAALDLQTTGTAPTSETGGYPVPNTKEFHAFWEAVQKEAARRFGVDEENDPVIVVWMTDQSRYEYQRLLAVPREIADSPYHPYGTKRWKEGVRDTETKRWHYPQHTPEEEEARQNAILDNEREILRMVSGNADMMQKRLERVVRDHEYALEKRKEAPARERAQRIQKLEGIKKIWDNPEAWAKERNYIYDARTFPPSIWNPDRGQLAVQRPENLSELMAELEVLKAYKVPEPLEL